MVNEQYDQTNPGPETMSPKQPYGSTEESRFDENAWQMVLRAAVASQELLPEAIAVRGTAAALYAHHRLSVDTDHLLLDLHFLTSALR